MVTGAASGIGAALARALAARGCDLALADRNAQGLAQVTESARAAGAIVSQHVLDVADADAIAALPDAVLAEHRKVSLLVNNAGVALAGSFAEIGLEDFAWLMDINFWAPVRLTRAFMGVLAREKAAHIVNVSSLFGLVAPPGQSAYAASKFGLRGFSEALRHELAGSPISLTVVHPGGVRTNIANSARIPQSLEPVAARARMAKFNRFLRTPPEAAAVAIVKAIVRRQPRLLIGPDARMADRIQRIFPQTYWRYIGRQAKI